jgi:hypothetical protein
MDAAGNLSNSSSAQTVTIDTVAPPAPPAPTLNAASDTGVSTTDRITRDTTSTFSGTAEINATVGLFDGQTATGNTTTATNGVFTTLTTATLATGNHSISVRPTDAAGNIGPNSPATVITIDITKPSVTLNQAATQVDPTTVSPIAFTAVFTETVYGFVGANVSLSGTALANTATVTGSDRNYTISVSGMTKSGSVVASLSSSKVQDVAGNLNNTATYTDRTVTFTDNVAPLVAISSFTALSDGTHQVTVSGTAGLALGDSATVTVVLCSSPTFPCTGTSIKASISGVAVNPQTGAWTVTSDSLGTLAALYARASQTDLTGNTGNSNIAGPIVVP